VSQFQAWLNLQLLGFRIWMDALFGFSDDDRWPPTGGAVTGYGLRNQTLQPA